MLIQYLDKGNAQVSLQWQHFKKMQRLIYKVQQIKIKPLNNPVGPPVSLPVGRIWNVLSLTPPITTSSRAPHTMFPDKLPTEKLEYWAKINELVKNKVKQTNQQEVKLSWVAKKVNLF